METLDSGVPPSPDDLRIYQFKKAWQQTGRPRLEDFLPEESGGRGRVLPALIAVDLVARLHAGDRARVEDYLERYPELRQNRAGVVELIATEFRTRDNPRGSLADYQKRFPDYAALLPAAFGTSNPPAGLKPTPGASATIVPPSSIGAPQTPPAPTERSAPTPSQPAPPKERTQPLPALPGSDTIVGPPSRISEPELASARTERSAPTPSQPGPPKDRTEPVQQPPVPSATCSLKPSEVGSRFDRTQPQAPLPGKVPTVEGYEILSVLGRGGMGVVYKARHIKLKRLVALKMILSGGHAGDDAIARFKIEAEAVARLQHPNIVQIYEIGSQDHQPYFSLEFIDGGSLDRQTEGKPQPVTQAASLIETLANAMHVAHEQGIIHRDLKPANILLTQTGEPKITDFGLAKQTDQAHGHTETGSVMGTPAYMAPEQAQGNTRHLGRSADIYSLGAILYELLTGEPPFQGQTVMDTLILVQTQEPKAPSKLRPRLPRDLETICLKCLEKEPERRYVTAAALAEDLRRFLNHEPILARPVRAWERGVKWLRRHPAGAACLALLLLSTTGALATYTVQTTREQQRTSSARRRIDEQFLRAQEAEKNEAWGGARDLLLSAAEESRDNPALARQNAIVQESLERVQRRLQAVGRLQEFTQARDEAIFHATLAGGETGEGNFAQTRTAVEKALAAVGLTIPVESAWVPDPAFTPEEQKEIRRTCYELLLTLSDTVAQRGANAAHDVRRERTQEALKILSGAEHFGLDTRAYHLRRGRYLAILGEQAAADKEAKRAAECPTQTARDHFLVGEEYYKRGDVSAARAEFEEALRVEGDGFWASYFLALCHVKLGQPRLAVEPLNYCLARKQRLAWIYLLRGFVYGQLGNYPAAEDDFSEVLSRAPSPEVLYVLYNNRAVMRVGQKNYKGATADLKAAIDLKPEQYQAYASMAQVEFLQGRFEEAVAGMDLAVAAAQKLVERNSVDATTLGLLYRARSRFQLARQDVSAALADLDRAAGLETPESPALPGLQAERGRLLHRLQRHGDAIVAYSAALKTVRPNPEIYRWKAEALVAAQRYPEAAEAFKDFTQAGGALAVKDYQLLALAHHKNGDLRAAVDDLTKILEMEPDNVEVLGQRAQVYLVVRAYTLAIRDFDRVQALSPDDANLYEGRAFAEAKLGQHQKAAGDAEEALRRGTPNARAYYRAARTLAQAAAQVDVERAGNDSPAVRTRRVYEDRALALLREALQKTPEGERSAFWRTTVRNDAELKPLHRMAGYGELERAYLRANVRTEP